MRVRMCVICVGVKIAEFLPRQSNWGLCKMKLNIN